MGERLSEHLSLMGLCLVCLLLLVGRALWEPRLGDGYLVEVYRDDGVQWRREAREVESRVVDLRTGPLAPVVVSDPLLVGDRIDVNEYGMEQLVRIPGVGLATARTIVEDRQRRGLFYEIDDLMRVRGIGPGRLEAITRYTTVGSPGSRPPPARLDVNRATVVQLDGLPGIGPILAERIHSDLAEHGPLSTIDELTRIRGIGPKTLERLRPLTRVLALDGW